MGVLYLISIKNIFYNINNSYDNGLKSLISCDNLFICLFILVYCRSLSFCKSDTIVLINVDATVIINMKELIKTIYKQKRLKSNNKFHPNFSFPGHKAFQY